MFVNAPIKWLSADYLNRGCNLLPLVSYMCSQKSEWT